MQPIDGTQHSFWDHLSVTRADEYAQEDELAHLPIPPAPVPPRTAAPSLAQPMQTLTEALQSVDADAGADLQDMSANWDTSTANWPEDPAFVQSQIADSTSGHDTSARWPEMTHAPVSAPPAGKTKRKDPARKRMKRPSRTGRLSYRLQRVWLTPFYRRALTIGVPAVAVVLSLVGYLLDETRRANLVAQWDAIYALVVDRPEFMVTDLRLIGAVPPAIENAIREVIEPELPQSSFRLDLGALRAELERLDAIRLADLRLTADKGLAVSITQRVPAALWRSSAGLEVLDAEGVRIGFVTDRAALPDLPLVAGDGADRRIGEALDLIEAATPLDPRLFGLVFMGERRWDVVLDRNQTIRLPETGPVAALERIIALDQAQDLLARDVMVADLRNPARPVLQVSAGALDTIRALRDTSLTERNAQ